MTDSPELDEVLALMERILPDPAAYGRRLVQQVVLQWAEAVPRSPAVVPGETASREEADAEGADADGTVAGLFDRIVRRAGPEPAAPDDAPTLPPEPVPDLLAAALGACDCWGTSTGCPTCDGAGSPGWAVPDLDLFQVYVAPAAERLTVLWEDQSADENGDESRLGHQRGREGASA